MIINHTLRNLSTAQHNQITKSQHTQKTEHSTAQNTAQNELTAKHKLPIKLSWHQAQFLKASKTVLGTNGDGIPLVTQKWALRREYVRRGASGQYTITPLGDNVLRRVYATKKKPVKRLSVWRLRELVAEWRHIGLAIMEGDAWLGLTEVQRARIRYLMDRQNAPRNS